MIYFNNITQHRASIKHEYKTRIVYSQQKKRRDDKYFAKSHLVLLSLFVVVRELQRQYL